MNRQHTMNPTLLIDQQVVYTFAAEDKQMRFVSCTCGWDRIVPVETNPVTEASYWARHMHKQAG